MTYSRSHKFDIELQELAKIAKALSHPARIAIIKLIASKDTCISGDISNELPLSRTTVSQHLKELKKVNVIQGEIDGLKVNYCLNPNVFNSWKTLFSDFFNEIDLDMKTCCKYNN